MPPDKIDERVPHPSAPAAAARLNHNNNSATSSTTATSNINSPQVQVQKQQQRPLQQQHQLQVQHHHHLHHQHAQLQLQHQHQHAAVVVPVTLSSPLPLSLAPPLQHSPQQKSQPIDSSRNAMERTSTHSLRAAFRSSYSNHTHNHNGGGVAGTIRAVTPEVGDSPEVSIGSSDASATTLHHSTSSAAAVVVASHETSPRSIPSAANNRRQGMVFNDFSDAYESTDSSPPPATASTSSNRLTSSSFRPRTRTMDTAMLTNQRAAPPGIEQRHRVGSMSSSGSQPTGPVPVSSEEPRLPAAGLESTGFPTIMGGRSFEAAMPTNKSGADKKANTSSRRLMKRQSSHPAPHPPVPYSPSIDSLATPIWIENPHKITQLMLTLCGKMRGEVEYQGESGGSWYMGLAYIDDERGCLMFDSGQSGPFHIPIVADLRGCRVYPVDYPEAGKRCLELISSNPVIEVLMYPREHSHFDFWLAALLCWQQLRPPSVKPSASKPSSPASPVRPELKRRGQSTDVPKSSAVIKVGKVQVWDKGLAANPYLLTKRSSTRDPRSSTMSWMTVSFTLSDNGELKLMAENDGTILAIIEMSQLSRSAVQQLDKTVLGEDHCIAVFPMYALKARQLSVFRPVYLAAETRVQFEVWFALLRAFTVPDIYKLDEPDKDLAQKVDDVDKARPGEVFRVEKTIIVRVTEAKMKPKGGAVEASPARPEKNSRTTLVDPLVGNYLAEVMLDGEVRARTMTKAATKNPFWREDCEFTDLPPTIPQLSVRLKNVEGYVEPPHSPAVKLSSNLNEVICGTVDLAQASTDPSSKDNEQWLPILDDKAETIGSMLIRVAHEELVVLLAKEYQPLAGILHNFPSNLTTQISNALPGHLRRVAELFLNIFQVSESASDWIMAMVEDEIDGIGSQATIKKYRFGTRVKSNESAESNNHRDLMVRDMNKSLTGEANLLFRGNTLLTQSLEFHMRRLGKEFLEETLKEKIYEINEADLDCEVDPSKLYQAVDLEQRWRRLIDITTDIWNCISTSAKRLHPELRGILKYIRAVAEDRYGDFLRTVAYTSVSGFLFLRFICPAILSPKLFGLLRDHPRPRAQRTFTLIAKALQKMANLSTFGKREEWMEPMNRFLSTQRSVFKEYVDQICDVPADHITKTIPPGYSTPLNILNRLSPTAREGFPSLPFLIDQARNYASLVKLWVDAKPGESTKKVAIEGELLIFNDICFALQSRSDSCLAKDESLELSEFRPGMTPDELAEVLEQASIFETATFSYAGSTTWTESEQPPGSSGSDTLEDNNRRSRDFRRTRDGHDKKRYMTSGGTAKAKNGKVGRTILNGIMRIGGRAESPEHKEKKSDSKSQK